MPRKRISVVLDEELYKALAKKLIDEKGKLALSEKIEELIREYLRKK